MSQSKFVPGLDYRTAEGLQRKRLLAFVNHFFSRTLDSLETFATNCDIKLIETSTRIKRLDNYLSLLETKLSSVSDLEQENEQEIKNKISNCEASKEESSSSSLPIFDEVVEEGASLSCRADPALSKFFKMIDVGVPLEAVKLKMRLEGLDTNILDFYLTK